MDMADTLLHLSSEPTSLLPRYSVEFFHIYSDEVISNSHSASIEYVKLLKEVFPYDLKLTVMIDNYNAKSVVTTDAAILSFLESQDVKPEVWAFEADLISNADKLVSSITSAKLQKQYLKYIHNKNKYPCSLLAAAWYLTRLGELDFRGVIRQSNGTFAKDYIPATRLINILPESYKAVEKRIIHLIKQSEFAGTVDKIQDLFYTAENGKIRELA